MIAKFDKATARVFQKEALAALKPLAEKYGVTVTEAGGLIEPTRFTAKFDFKTADAGAKAVEQAQTDFRQYAQLFDLLPEDYGKTFKHGNHTFTITGLKLGAPKYSLTARRSDGKLFKFRAEDIAKRLRPVAGKPWLEAKA
jgi:hypothetical protein